MKYVGFTMFNDDDDENKWLTHSFCSKFVVDNVEFCSVEQFLIYNKAKLFGDFEICKQVMATTDGQVLHKLGRSICSYNDDTWAMVRENISYIGNKQKFLCNQELQKKLYNTGFTELVYCCNDQVWGRNSKGIGSNALGKAVMKVRDNDICSLTKMCQENDMDYFEYIVRTKTTNLIDGQDFVLFCKLNNFLII